MLIVALFLCALLITLSLLPVVSGFSLLPPGEWGFGTNKTSSKTEVLPGRLLHRTVLLRVHTERRDGSRTTQDSQIWYTPHEMSDSPIPGEPMVADLRATVTIQEGENIGLSWDDKKYPALSLPGTRVKYGIYAVNRYAKLETERLPR